MCNGNCGNCGTGPDNVGPVYGQREMHLGSDTLFNFVDGEGVTIIEPGDTIVFKTNQLISETKAAIIEMVLAHRFPNNHVVLLPSTIEIAAVVNTSVIQGNGRVAHEQPRTTMQKSLVGCANGI